MCRAKKIKVFQKVKGFNLVELLVSLVVVAVSLFAVAKIQITGMQSLEGSKQSTGSTVSISNLIERLSAHRDAVRTVLGKSVNDFSAVLLNRDYLKTNVIKNDAYCDATDEFDIDQAKKILNCEIDAWIYSVYNALNLKQIGDICANVYISDTPHYQYKTNFKYRIPRVIVEYKWKKTPSVDMSADSDCAVSDSTHHMAPPKYDKNPFNDRTAEIGYSAMEYLLP